MIPGNLWMDKAVKPVASPILNLPLPLAHTARYLEEDSPNLSTPFSILWEDQPILWTTSINSTFETAAGTNDEFYYGWYVEFRINSVYYLAILDAIYVPLFPEFDRYRCAGAVAVEDGCPDVVTLEYNESGQIITLDAETGVTADIFDDR